jgi:tetratricopeptide (TPR) repeat protein
MNKLYQPFNVHPTLLRKHLGRLLLCCVLLAPLLTTPAFSAPSGTITKFSGEVYYRAKDHTAYVPLRSVMEISAGGWVKTGKNGWIELVLLDKSRFIIANNSELELVRFQLDKKQRDGLFTLTQGKLRASIMPSLGLTSSLKVRNKSVVAGMKGTEFLMLAEGPANVFFGNEGRVAISGHDDKEQDLLPRYMTQATRGYSPIDPVAVEPGTPIADAKAAFESVTGTVPPEEWAASDNLPSIIARWNISYGHYLADSGKYEQALQVFQIALDLAKAAEIRCDARLERSAVYSRFLANPEAAMSENLLILEEYPKSPQAEAALFNVGQILFELSYQEQARARLQEYLHKYPRGKQRSNVETLLGILNK